MAQYVIGIDFGSLSARSIMADIATGRIIAEAVSEYAHGVIYDELSGKKLGPSWALQDPADYLTALTESVRSVMEKASAAENVVKEQVLGLSLDFTCCTLMPLKEDLTPLCFLHPDRPNAWVKLWKHHSAQAQADRACQTAGEMNEPFLARYGGTFSADWAIPKIMETMEQDPDLCREIDLYMEAGEWLTSLLVGKKIKSSSFACFKSCYDIQEGYPSDEYFAALMPDHPEFVQEMHKLTDLPVMRIGQRAGTLTPEYAEKLGLCPGTFVGVPSGDAYASIAGMSATASGDMIMMLGTSSSDLMNSDRFANVSGVDAVIRDGILPGMVTYEAGQYATGDMLGWFTSHMVPAAYAEKARQRGISLHQYLTERAAAIPADDTKLTVLEWWNGNRSILNDSDLPGVILGLTLTTRPEAIYRAMMEATCFGQKVILDNYEAHQVPVGRIFLCGGIAMSNPFMVQLYADILGRELEVSTISQSSSLGSCMYAACAVGKERGGYDSIYEAATHMKCYPTVKVQPDPEKTAVYQKKFERYQALYDFFGKRPLRSL